ncbi:MAG: class A beta-lactamase, partial [Muribaculaceae bacterium]|nr:class A beta-lactamase [Muribaculaceae bacterium]
MKVVLSLTFLILLMSGVSSCRHGDDGDLASQISTILSTHDVSVGVAVIINDSDTVVVNNNRRYPLMSVFKFHQALAVCDAMARKNCGLDSLIHVNRDDLQPDTYSPLRDDSVAAEFDISVTTLLDYT